MHGGAPRGVPHAPARLHKLQQAPVPACRSQQHCKMAQGKVLCTHKGSSPTNGAHRRPRVWPWGLGVRTRHQLLHTHARMHTPSPPPHPCRRAYRFRLAWFSSSRADMTATQRFTSRKVTVSTTLRLSVWALTHTSPKRSRPRTRRSAHAGTATIHANTTSGYSDSSDTGNKYTGESTRPRHTLARQSGTKTAHTQTHARTHARTHAHPHARTGYVRV